eukprot:TRINITY_DN7425_c0_g1_i1.p1 TRINITY_DN7425_c0_g1~~TRINITY_DN7425_c0_g1_i1.p1  ORF type:complete len:259 (+),score=38.49 TRINITY_DN7425_c0_g1_i1:51-827(+)
MSVFMGVTYKVTQLAQAVDYYVKYLGFKLVSEPVNPYSKEKSAILSLPGVRALLTLVGAAETKDFNKGTAYGHIALKSDDIYKTCEEIQKAGGKLPRPPGPVKGGTTVIAFVEDLDGYKIELIQRPNNWKCSFLHVMLRVGNLERTKAFYSKLGMEILKESENSEYKYTLVFAGYEPEELSTVLEFTYNWGTESYDHGNSLMYLTIAAKNLKLTYQDVVNAGGKIVSEPAVVEDVTQFVALDPDGYKIVFAEATEFKV